MARLQLHSEPRPVYFPAQVRSQEQIDPNLRAKIKECVNAQSPWPLVLIGPAGIGKSCSSLCLLDRVRDEPIRMVVDGKEGYKPGTGEGVYFAAQEACNLVAAAMRSNGATKAFWTRWEKAALGVLDEVGSREKVTDHHYNTVKQMIDLRAGKPLIVISNLSLLTLATLYDDRITSRLAAGTVLTLEGEDRRQQP